MDIEDAFHGKHRYVHFTNWEMISGRMTDLILVSRQQEPLVPFLLLVLIRMLYMCYRWLFLGPFYVG